MYFVTFLLQTVLFILIIANCTIYINNLFNNTIDIIILLNMNKRIIFEREYGVINNALIYLKILGSIFGRKIFIHSYTPLGKQWQTIE